MGLGGISGPGPWSGNRDVLKFPMDPGSWIPPSAAPCSTGSTDRQVVFAGWSCFVGATRTWRTTSGDHDRGPGCGAGPMVVGGSGLCCRAAEPPPPAQNVAHPNTRVRPRPDPNVSSMEDLASTSRSRRAGTARALASLLAECEPTAPPPPPFGQARPGRGGGRLGRRLPRLGPQRDGRPVATAVRGRAVAVARDVGRRRWVAGLRCSPTRPAMQSPTPNKRRKNMHPPPNTKQRAMPLRRHANQLASLLRRPELDHARRREPWPARAGDSTARP